MGSNVSCSGRIIPNSDQLARFWDKVALTEEESRAVDALNLIYSDKVERIAMIGDDIGARLATWAEDPL